ncbi:MAG TPA: cysteine desulfurase, partial [Bacteroidales bacterium]|nr:cysteine desulfurase [Bacteroidales bacterium]
MPIDPHSIRQRFPLLTRQVHGKPLVYLDNAATTQKPEGVLEAMDHYYRALNSNIHRGVYTLAQEATDRYEEVRQAVARFLHAPAAHEIIFTRGTTESINLVAQSFGQRYLREGDEVVVSVMEHHSNIVPWQLACQRSGARLKVLGIDGQGRLDMDALDAILGERTRLLALTQVSNVTGRIHPVREIIRKAHALDIPVLIDGAQSAPHLAVDVQELDCDFFAFSGHKAYGPMGIGVLYGKERWLEEMPPWQGGGEMIDRVTFEETTYNELPYKFEAGTPAVAEALGLKAALDFMEAVGMPGLHALETELMAHAWKKLEGFPGMRLYSAVEDNAGVISFLLDGIHPYDLGTLLDRFGIAVRTGHHCAQPLMDHWGVPGTVRLSVAAYNTTEEIDIFAE